MRRTLLALIILFVATSAQGAKENPVKPVTEKHKFHRAAKKKARFRLVTEKQKTLYSVGLVLARQLEVFDLTPAEQRIVRRGFYDALRGRKPKVDLAVFGKKSQELALARRDAHGKKLIPLVPEFMAKEAAREGAVKTPSGLIYQQVKEGDGAFPTATDKIKVHYRSTLIDGKEMGNTYKLGQPDELVVQEFMKCLAEGVQMMKPGGKARLICPPEIGLGKEGSDVIPPDATLVFDMELVEVVPAKQQSQQ